MDIDSILSEARRVGQFRRTYITSDKNHARRLGKAKDSLDWHDVPYKLFWEEGTMGDRMVLEVSWLEEWGEK